MSTQPKIYRSSLPLTPLIQESIFTYLMESTYHKYDPLSPAFIDADSRISITRAKLKHLSLRLGFGLRNHILLPSIQDPRSLTTLTRGDTVMVFGANTMSWPATVFGCLAAGLRATFASCSLTPRELSWQWTDSKARVIFVAPDLVTVALRMFELIGVSEKEAHQRMWVMDQLWDDSLPQGQYQTGNWMGALLKFGKLSAEERFDGEDANETAYICYSSGTTGRPKGVETTHKNVCTIMGMCKGVWAYVETDEDVQLGLMPFYHIFGLVMHLNYPFMAGQPCVLMLHGFDAEGLCRNVERFGVTTIMLAPPIILTLSLHPGMERYNMTSLKCIASAAAPLPLVVAERLIERLVKQGADVKLIQGCGATETTCPTQMVLPPDHQRKFGSIGQLLPNIELRLVDDNGNDVPVGEPGEVWVRGPTIMKGYLNNPRTTADSFAPGQWYKSGDIMRRDSDGYYYIVDRKKEMIKYKVRVISLTRIHDQQKFKGFQVAPAELEAILLENEAIADVGVIGVVSEFDKNELPRAYIVPNDLTALKSFREKRNLEKTIEEWMRGQVAYYKYLRGGVVAVPEIPKSSSGKILRKDLRDWAKKELRSSRL